MNFVNDYILFKLLFDDGPAKRGAGNRTPRPPSVSIASPSRRSSLLSVENRRISASDWRGSCIDVSHLSTHHLPIKQRLQRKRSGSWSAGTGTSLQSDSMMTIAEGDECASRKPSICPTVKSFRKLSTVNNHHFLSPYVPDNKPNERSVSPPPPRAGSPKITVSTVRKKLSFPNQSNQSEMKMKEKLSRKRSSCPNAVEITTEVVDLTKLEDDDEVSVDDTGTGHRIAVTISPSLENAEYSLLTSYLRIYQSASRDDDEPPEEERDSVVLHLGYNYPEDLLWNRSSHSCSTSPRWKISPSKQTVINDPPVVGDLIVFSDESGGEDIESDTDLEDVFEKHLKITKEVHRSSNPETVRNYHAKLFNTHTEAEHCNSDPTLSKRRKFSSTSKRNSSMTMNSMNTYRRYKFHKECPSTPLTSSRKASSSYKPTGSITSRLADNRRSQKVRSPSAPSPRGGSFRRRLFSTEDTSQVSKIGLSPRSSRTLQIDNPVETNPVRDSSEDLLKDKRKISRTHSSVLQPIKALPVEPAPEILLTLSYSTSIGFITITINKAKNLPLNLDSYVKVMLFENHRLLELKQTTNSKEKINPEYKQAYMFGLGKSSITNINFVIEVWGHSPIGDEQKIGHVVLGVAAGGTGSVQWIRMVKHTGFPAIMWHKLVVGNGEESSETGC